MINHTISSVKVSATLKVSDDKEIDSTSATDALRLLFEETKDEMNISSTCAYNWREPFVELEYDSLEEANKCSATDFEYLAAQIRELYSENEVRRKESEALQKIYDDLDQTRCDIANGRDKQHNETEIENAMAILMGKMSELEPIGATW
jgi:hypothetical protein